MNRTVLLSSLLLVACGSATDAVQDGDEPTSNATSRGLIEPIIDEGSESPTLTDVEQEEGLEQGELGSVDPSTPPPPADTATLRGLLAARHVADLPNGDTLRGYETGEASLQWLANYGDTMATRTRALMLLKHFGTEGTRAFALDHMNQDEPQLQAAAITALAGQDLDAAPELVESIAAALRTADVRIALAALTTLSEFEAGRAALAEAATDETVEASIREAAAAASTAE